jgi:O-antigen/teichoic acid export membrane protein
MPEFYKRIYGGIITALNKGHKRSVKARKNIFASFGIKAAGLIVAFVKVPIILNYLNIDKYGVWLTIASIVTWVNYFDMGIGHGLRNKFAVALAENNHQKAAKLVSTAYFYITLIFLGIGLIVVPFIFFADWQNILNTTLVSNRELMFSVLAVFIIFITRFIFNLLTSILKGDQRPAMADLFLPVGSVLSLIFILLMDFIEKDSLFLASIAIALPPLLTVFIANIIFFSKKYRHYRPRFSMVDKKHFTDIFSLGVKFFAIQLAALVMFASSNIILTQIVNPEEVSIYNIARQYYTLPFMFFGIILSPYWSAITDAYTKNELFWIKNAMKKLFLIGLVFCVGLFTMFLISDFAFRVWLGKDIEIPLTLSLSFVILNTFYIFFAPFSHFINGVGKLSIALRLVIFKMIIYLPVAILLTKWGGATGLVLALIIVNSIPSSIIETWQYIKIINRKAKGIWNK